MNDIPEPEKPVSTDRPLEEGGANISRSSGLAPLASSPQEFDKWIENFYKECGREVTLAYTTLNQMKNWAMVIVAAFISAAVTLGKPGGTEVAEVGSLGIFAAAVGAYVFNLRFFVRAILCYINLTRWNVLQARIVSAYLVRKPLPAGSAPPSPDEARADLRQQIEEYFHNWRSPIGRKSQLIQNLKLGFALVLALPAFFVIVWAVELWDQPLVRGLAVFALGSTLVEFTDFARSSYFDTPERHRQRSVQTRPHVFPVPVSQGGYLLTWVLNLFISAVIALWPKLWPTLKYLIDCAGGNFRLAG